MTIVVFNLCININIILYLFVKYSIFIIIVQIVIAPIVEVSDPFFVAQVTQFFYKKIDFFFMGSNRKLIMNKCAILLDLGWYIIR